jgi:hypothetical protein
VIAERKILSIADIESAQDIDFVEVEAWGAFVRLGSLTAGDMLDFVEANEGPAKRTAGLRLIVKSLVDDSGNRIGKLEHLEVFKKKDARTINKLIAEVLKLNGLTDKEGEKAKNDSSGANPDASPSA